MHAAGRFREAELLEIGADWERDAHERRERGLARTLSGALTAAAACGLVALALMPAPPPMQEAPRDIAELVARPDPVLTAPPPDWRALEIPQIVLGLDAPGFSGLASRHVARIHADGAREDALVFGAFAEPGTHMRLALRRDGPGTTPEAERSFFVEAALAAAQAGLAIVRTGPTQAVATRFGTLEAAELVLENGPVRTCLAFRGGVSLGLSGWLCDAHAAPETLACVVDGLVLLDPGGDTALARAFAAPAGAHGCAPAGDDPASVASIAPAPPTRGGGARPQALPQIVVPMPVPPPRPAHLGFSS
ncbi:hypothetical protein [Salinarimonas ramus]|uniref:Uncharacterized protein n=1 Tax=Salinarimonas ramus TaxID=690164 RepID=A0A917V447_9HYPH|nr:hypothetical protein [Salinarimonas ramus]GGK34205.1 hypothetical protein GCM10011322_21160 [Salinarimonas ramus]